MITGSLGYSCAAFIQMGLSSSSASAAAAAQRMHRRAFRTASLPPNALKHQQTEALKATQNQTRHASITFRDSAESSTNNNGPVPKPLLPPKRVFVVRHGQAQHNPRAEAAREAGCSFDEFLRLMELDDAYDADLTSLGESQAQTAGEQHALSDIEMVVSSPLSRALKTADLVHPPVQSSEHPKPRRIAIEHFREINGKLLNAQRRPRADLEQMFPHWCFQQIPPLDLSWTEELETREDCSERGYRGLLWVLEQPEQNVLLVAHGGLLNYMMNGHDNVVLVDGRQSTNGDDSESEARCITKRFGNCELREFIITAWDPASSEENCSNQTKEPVVTLEEVTLSIKL